MLCSQLPSSQLRSGQILPPSNTYWIDTQRALVLPTTPALLWPQRFEAIQKFSLPQNIGRFVNQGAEQACCTLFYTDLLPASLVGFVQPHDIDIHSHESTQVLAMNLLKY